MYEPSARFDVKVFDVEIPRDGSPLLARSISRRAPDRFRC